MQAHLAGSREGQDPRRLFHATYLRTTQAEFDDPALPARRASDHRHIDRVLGSLVDEGGGGQKPLAAVRA
jgi:hypothetical protein